MAKNSKGQGLRFQPSGGQRNPLPSGKKQHLAIERLAHDGRGIGHIDGRTWLVSGALPGETVEARVLSARGRVVEARAERIFQQAALRRTAPCALAGQCGGCSLQHLPHAEQLALKQQALAEQLQGFSGVIPESWAPPLLGSELGYRRRTRIALRWDERQQRLAFGFRAAASQAIVEVTDCPVLVPALRALLPALAELLRSLSKPRNLGHVELFQGTACALLLRHMQPLPDEDLARLQAFCSAHQLQLWLQGEGAPQAVLAEQALGYRLDDWGLTLAYQPGDFVQVNDPMNAAMIKQALDWLAPGPEERVLDLFCGLGNFSLPLARRAREVVGVEGVSNMVERATANARANAVKNAVFYQADLQQPLAHAAWAAQSFSAVLLDPPRDGAWSVVQHIGRLGAQRVLYVSCNPATLARDAGALVKQGYACKRAGILDMFPQTAHVEAMLLFTAG